MTSSELSFREIEIRRMPGFPSGGLKVDGLCRGVNVIYGPNASGKTTLSRAIQKLLRPMDPPHEQRSIRGSLELHGDSYTLDCDLGRVRCQRDGLDVDCPPLAPTEIGDHYVLALHDLIRTEDDRDLAAQIIREAAGGYDVGEAARELGFQDRPSGKGKLTRELENAIKARREARRQQEALVDREKTLADLRVKRDHAREAGVRGQWLQKALEHAGAVERHQEAQHELDAFPPGVGRLAGDEIDRLGALRTSLSKGRGRRRDEQSKLDLARRTISDCSLPKEGVATELLGALRMKCQRLETLSAEIRSRRQQLDEAEAAMDLARRNLGPAIRDQQFDSLDLGTVEELSTFARRAERLRAEANAAEELRAWLGAEEQPEPEDPETLNYGVRLLQKWIAADDVSTSPPRKRPFLLAAAGAIAAISLLMSLAVHLSWLALLAVAVGLVVWAFVPRATSDAKAATGREFESLGVGSPPSWAPDQVRSFVAQLQRRCAEATLRQEKATRWGRLSDQLEDLARRREQLDKEKAAWIERLGVATESQDAGEAWLYLLVANVNRLQQAQERSATARAALDHASNEHQSLLREVNETICPFGCEPVDDPESALSQVEQLYQRSQAHQTATETLAGGTRALAVIDEEIATAEAEEAKLFDDIGLGADQEAILREWSQMHSEYLQAQEKLRFTQRDCQSAEAALADQPDMMELSRQELEDELDRCRRLADQLESFNQAIGAIENAIDTAKMSTDLEAKLAREQECADVLRQLREQDYEAMVGHVLADFLLRQQRDREHPGVFLRARELLADITRGRYRLDIDPGDPPGFRAFDTERAVGLRLEELSSGTRLQLLLAVRVAFVERQEQGARLPLILDETLGNSDERRAAQIIDAAIEICRKGRQVFYLTAQHDEVGKWNAILSRYGDVEHKLIDLAQLRGFAESDRVAPIEYQRPESVEVPPPEGLDWLAYGRRLGVSAFDARRELGSAHLWYLIDDLPTLCRLLRQGIERWGQLQTLAACAKDDSLRADSEVYRRAEAAARLLESASRYWRIGRPAAVDRRALVDSGAVSRTYIDRVSDLAVSLGGDAEALLAGLEAGQVRGFRADNRDQLRDYLDAEGYLDQRDVLGAGQIHQQVRAVVFSEMEQGLISAERLEQLVAVVVGQGADESATRW